MTAPSFTELEITTLANKQFVKSEVVQNLTIRGLNESTVFQLPKAYSLDEIPADRSLIPRPETV